jgi:Na+/melibiose symporter-like transporter
MKKNIFTLIGTIAVLFTGCENNTAEDLMSNSTSKSNDIIQLEIQSANDYNIYKTGKDRSALTMVAGGFIVKAQAALSAAIIGAVLMSIGYNVDPVTSEYMGELSQIPTMLNWFIVIMGLVPAILGALSALILRTYPIKDDERRKIRECLDHRNAG